MTIIAKSAFYSCSSLSSITIPTSVTSIESETFYKCTSLTSLTIPSSVTSIGSSAFYGCSGLTSLIIPSSVTSIGASAFYRCIGLTSLAIPLSITSIEASTFLGCSGLTSFTIPLNVTSIGASAFSECSGLTSIHIPSNVTSIGASAFMLCSGLTTIYAYSQKPIALISWYVFLGVKMKDCTLKVPIGSLNSYRIASQWKDFNNIEEFSTTNVELIKADDLKIYPNPVTHGFQINGINGLSMLKLSDINSKVLLTKEINNNEYISLSSLPRGVYFVIVNSAGKTIEKKLVKK